MRHENTSATESSEDYLEAILVIRAERGCIAVVSADCPDGACVRQGWIRRAGAGTVCLPHRLVVRIKGADRQVDGVSW